jgi:hypothetical protein
MPNPITPADLYDVDVECVVCFETGPYRYAPGMGYVCSGYRSDARRENEPSREEVGSYREAEDE